LCKTVCWCIQHRITCRLILATTSAKHFGFEGAAWYWHFVDVVWLGLYVLVYWM